MAVSPQSGEVDIDFDRIFTHSCAHRHEGTCNRGKEIAPAKLPAEPAKRARAGRQAGRQPGQAGKQASRQGGKQPSSQAVKQANRQQGRGKLPAEGDLGQFLKLGKNPLCLAAYLGKNAWILRGGSD